MVLESQMEEMTEVSWVCATLGFFFFHLNLLIGKLPTYYVLYVTNKL
jgi:hypothetical protein